MALTQESVLSLLITEGGKVKKSDLVSRFKGTVDCNDPAQRERNRELFKTFVNNLAVVKEIDGVRYVVVKKMYQHLLDDVQTTKKTDNKEIPPTGEQQRPPVRSEHTESCVVDAGGERSAVSEPDSEQESSENSEHPTELLSPIELALRRSKFTDIKVKRVLKVEIQKQDTDGDSGSRSNAANEPISIQSKPYALPLRLPPSTTRVEIRKLKVDPDEPPESPTLQAFRNKRRPPSIETGGSIGSPQLRRAVKSTKDSEEPKDTRFPSVVPLEQSEHEWLVKCAAGHWSQVYGLLLRDNQLAEKKDFMSGFTALHWAAKCGNSSMLVKIIHLAKEGGVDIDINAKTHGGYTPLHIAALHNQEYIMAMLVGEYSADPSIRDNCGKRAYHYLHKGVSGTVREMLGEPKAQQTQDRVLHEKEELDLFPDLSKGLHSISRLFQPHTSGYKKKHKQRMGFSSVSDDPGEEHEDSISSISSVRSRIVSDAFM
uniref:ankyrin repeat domain-containing protein SOWAHA-like n=1 Tax=Scatophagus argus TaxID=75038 RepID=UPI001ED81BE6|nr:ankyrin repeat domain-containing protein SOWAHA-like [Scatophagus argus]